MTRNYQHNILGQEIDSLCRLCNNKGETIDHHLSGCEALANTSKYTTTQPISYTGKFILFYLFIKLPTVLIQYINLNNGYTVEDGLNRWITHMK
jgi:hypothetical protein